MATVRSRFDKGQPASQWDERDKFQEDAIQIIERYYQHPTKDAYSITGQIYDDLVRPLKQHGTEPLQMLLAASMLVQRLKDLSSWTRNMAIKARGSANSAYIDTANSIDGILNEFATDSKDSNERESISRCPKCQRRMPDRNARFCIGSDCGYDTMESKT